MRTENDYFDATATGRIQLRKSGKVGVLEFNGKPSTSMPTSSAAIEIGRFSVTLAKAYTFCAPSQAGGAPSLMVSISASGVLTVYNGNSANASGWYRAVIPVLFV